MRLCYFEEHLRGRLERVLGVRSKTRQNLSDGPRREPRVEEIANLTNPRDDIVAVHAIPVRRAQRLDEVLLFVVTQETAADAGPLREFTDLHRTCEALAASVHSHSLTLPLMSWPQGQNMPRTQAKPSLPKFALAGLSFSVFVTSLTETLPAGLLPAISQSMNVPQWAAGQAVTVYALGTIMTAIPLSRATADWERRRVIVYALSGFLLANLGAAVAPNFTVFLMARFLSGVAGGLAWAALAAYARLLAPAQLSGRAVAVAMTGVPLALSVGVPVGSLLGNATDWRVAFAAMSVLAAVSVAWIIFGIPQTPDPRTADARGGAGLRETLRAPGVAAIEAVTLLMVLGHTVLFAFVAVLAEHRGGTTLYAAILTAFGVSCLISVWVAGRWVDKHLSLLTAASLGCLAVAGLGLAVAPLASLLVVAACVWGLGWGAAPTLLQTSAAVVGGRSGWAVADSAQALLVTLWNVAMALGGAIGAVVILAAGPIGLPVVMSVFAVFAAIAHRRVEPSPRAGSRLERL